PAVWGPHGGQSTMVQEARETNISQAMPGEPGTEPDGIREASIRTKKLTSRYENPARRPMRSRRQGHGILDLDDACCEIRVAMDRRALGKIQQFFAQVLGQSQRSRQRCGPQLLSPGHPGLFPDSDHP